MPVIITIIKRQKNNKEYKRVGRRLSTRNSARNVVFVFSQNDVIAYKRISKDLQNKFSESKLVQVTNTKSIHKNLIVFPFTINEDSGFF